MRHRQVVGTCLRAVAAEQIASPDAIAKLFGQ